MMNVIVYRLLPVCLVLTAACAPRPQRVRKIIPLTDNILSSVTAGQSGSLARDGIEVSVEPLSPEQLQSYSIILKPIRPEDIQALFKQGYINYADDENRELLQAYRLAGRYPYRSRYDLFGNELAADGWQVNPYLNAERPVLVFRVTIENRSPGKVAVKPSESVLLDGRGGQAGPLQPDGWRGFAPLAWSPDQVMVACGRPGGVTGYFVPRRYLLERKVAEKTLLQDTKIYPGVTMEGLLVFPMVGDDVREFSVVLPEVEFYDEENMVLRRRDFTYRFMIADVPTP